MAGSSGFPVGQAGLTDGYAVSIPQTATGNPPSQILSKSISLSGVSSLTISMYYQGKTLTGGLFSISYSLDSGVTWTSLKSSSLNPAVTTWTLVTSPVISVVGKSAIRLLVSCNGGSAVTNYCAVDTVRVLKVA